MDAEERKAELMAQNKMSDGRMFKLDFDPRVIGNKILPDGSRKTGIGEFIRKTSLDEFPQFWNVLNGTMSLVGTRPILQDELLKYELHHRARIAIKPGITGMWQVSGRSDITDFEEVVRLDESRNYREKIYISYDSTNKNCQAGDIKIVEFGHPKVDMGEPVFNYAVVYDTHNQEPLFYEKYPGSLNDISQLQFMLDKASGYGYKKIGFILDRGYFSCENIQYMDKCGYSFVIMVKGIRSAIFFCSFEYIKRLLSKPYSSPLRCPHPDKIFHKL